MLQTSRNATGGAPGQLDGQRYLLHDRDTKIRGGFRNLLRSAGAQPPTLPAQSPNPNAFAERWARSVKPECLSRLNLFGKPALCRALTGFANHCHAERNRQGKDNNLLYPRRSSP